MPRYYRENDGFEPRLTFRLASGFELTVLLPLGDRWEEELAKLTATRPEVVSARIDAWNGNLILDLQNRFIAPRTVKTLREDDT